MSTVALPVVPDNFLALLSSLGSDFVGNGDFAPLLEQAKAHLSAQGMDTEGSTGELPFLQAVQAAAKAQGLEGSALVQAFAGMKLDPMRMDAVMDRFASAPPALQPALMVLDQIEMRLNTVGESLTNVESAEELTNLLQTRLNLPEPEADLLGKAGGDALAQLVIALEHARQPKTEGHFFNSDLQISAEQVTLERYAKLKTGPLLHGAPYADASQDIDQILEELASDSSPEQMPTHKPLTENIAEILSELAPPPEPPVESTGAVAQAMVDVVQVQKQAGAQTPAHALEAQRIADLLGEDAPQQEGVQTPRNEDRPQAIRWQQTNQGFDMVQEVPADDMAEVFQKALDHQAPITKSVDGIEIPELAERPVTVATAQRTAPFKPVVAEQLTEPFKLLLRQDGGAMKVTLHPAELGEVQIQLEVIKGQVTGRIMVQNAEVLEHLARELHSLRQGLAESGLTLGEEGIVLFHQEQHGEGHQHAGGDTSGESDSALESADENESEFEDGNWIAADKLVDVNV